MRHNPYLLRFRELERKREQLKSGIFMMELRYSFCKKYAFAIPDSEAIRLLVNMSPVVELGAGTGYWASLIARYGGVVHAYDSREGKYGFKDTYYPVRNGNEEMLSAYDRGWTLLLCWPCYNSPFAYHALQAFNGNQVCYVGEGDGGCTGDDRFHWELERHWQLVTTHQIPRWPHIHDRLTVYKRKETEDE